MAKNSDDTATQPAREGVISIIGPGMHVTGDCETKGTLRIEGSVDGTVRTGKAVVVGKDGVVDGDVVTQDAVIGGRITGSITAASRLELQATCVIEGEIRARRLKLEEGGTVKGMVHIGEVSTAAGPGRPAPPGADAKGSPGAPGADKDAEKDADRDQDASGGPGQGS